ncbi:capsule biosynthesis GfcC family protein [Luteimonas abyssi]|uniref:capsule biosynthesis GfcC family protein n=1 Tax=Luteimonas abyssi TaxID=1247514 RepID=UPI000737BF94|nr:capsule biosynthesis GfcC family protein [Luteimonas abyssi]
MSARRWCGPVLALVLGACPPALAESPAAPAPALHVTVEGAVLQPGAHAFAPGARRADAVLAGMPDRRAYLLGAALLTRSALATQVRERAGLLHDLGMLEAAYPEVAGLARLHARIRALPATGRVPAMLEPRGLEVDPPANRPLHDGDRFVFPLRPRTVRLDGALEAACEVPHVALRDARAYLDTCPPLAQADRDWLYAIQPDGHVERLGTAPWNRSAAYPLAPGAVLYVPISEAAVRDVAPGVNAAMAAFLATQPLPGPDAPAR